MSSTVTRAPRRNRQFWINHVERWRSSNLSKAAYCEQHSLSIGNFYNWSRPERGVNVKADQREHQRPEGKSVVTKPLSFVPVTVMPVEPASDTCVVHVKRAATHVELPADLNAEQIQHWLTAVHQLHV